MSPTMVGRRKEFWVLEALETADWRSKIGQDFFHSFGNDAKIDLYVDKMEVSIPLIKEYRNKDI